MSIRKTSETIRSHVNVYTLECDEPDCHAFLRLTARDDRLGEVVKAETNPGAIPNRPLPPHTYHIGSALEAFDVAVRHSAWNVEVNGESFRTYCPAHCVQHDKENRT